MTLQSSWRDLMEVGRPLVAAKADPHFSQYLMVSMSAFGKWPLAACQVRPDKSLLGPRGGPRHSSFAGMSLAR